MFSLFLVVEIEHLRFMGFLYAYIGILEETLSIFVNPVVFV